MAYTQPPTRTDGVHTVTAADFNAYTRDNFIEVEARKEIDYVENTGSVSITATTAATANTIITAGAFTPNGTDQYRIYFNCGEVFLAGNAGGNSCIFHLYDGATNVGRIGNFTSVGTTSETHPVFLVSRKLTPTNASHTYSVRAHRTNANCTIVGGNGGADIAYPTVLWITRLP